MKTKNLLPWLLLLLGEAVIITAFILFRGETETNILTLNIVVSSIVYGLFFVDALVPWVDFKDASHKRVGAIGLRWVITWIYAFLAIAAMILSNVVYALPFTTQLWIHAALLFFVLLGLFGVSQTAQKVKNVHDAETNIKNYVVEMKKAMADLKEKISRADNLPDDFLAQINALDENLRYLSPSNREKARELEQSFIETIKDIGFALHDFSLNEEKINHNVKKCERIFQNRKQIYST